MSLTPPETSSVPSVTERAIPRPSERRGSHPRRVHAGPGLTIEVDSTRGSDTTQPGSVERVWPAASLRAFGVLCGLGAGIAFGLIGLLGRAETTVGVVVAPLLLAFGALTIRRYVTPIAGEFVAATALAGLGARLLGAVPRLLTGADATAYQREGERIAGLLRSFDFAVDTGRSVPGTGTVRYVSGIVNVLTFGNYVAAFLIFASVAFVGQVFLLLAAKPALTERQMAIASVLVMFSPTMVYWPSSIGKESLVLFGLGISFWGASKLYEREWSGLVTVLAGGLTVGMVRPHVAMLVVSAVLIGLFARNAKTKRNVAVHIAALVLVVGGAMLATDASAQLFNVESLDGIADVTAALDFTEDRTSQDESGFNAVRVNSVLDYLPAAVSVLFRPFIWEASGIPAIITALEGAALAALVAYASLGMVSQIRVVLGRGQLLFAVTFSSLFIFVFSAIGNFGILSRQRAQVIPFVLLLVAVGVGVDHTASRRGTQQ